jgi:hypothetical protein
VQRDLLVTGLVAIGQILEQEVCFSTVAILCGTRGEGRGAYRVFVGKPEGRRTIERSRRRWEDNIKMDL